ncbi:MAG: hypothetical protein H7843_16415 [Nitrospirota bacterium]
MSDQLGTGTQQNLLSGGDGAKLYGWSLLNSSLASPIDVNITNAGQLTIALTNQNAWLTSKSGYPFVYQSVTGDFDIDAHITARGKAALLIASDRNISANENNVAIGWYLGEQTIWYNTVEGSESGSNNGTTRPYVRMTRVGNVFTLYAKVNTGDSWTQFAQYTRSDFNSNIFVGFTVISGNNGTGTAQFDYIEGTYSGLASTVMTTIRSDSAAKISRH